MNGLESSNSRAGRPVIQPERSTHYHWIVWAYAKREPLKDEFYGAMSVEVLADSYAEALNKVENLIPRISFTIPSEAGYAVRQVIEHMDGACNGGQHH